LIDDEATSPPGAREPTQIKAASDPALNSIVADAIEWPGFAPFRAIPTAVETAKLGPMVAVLSLSESISFTPAT
jgi:hypothetical protein